MNRKWLFRNVVGMEPMKSKLSKLRDLFAAGKPLEALRIAARFPDLGDERNAIQQGWAAHQRPEFYREIGKRPEELIEVGLAALVRKYRLG